MTGWQSSSKVKFFFKVPRHSFEEKNAGNVIQSCQRRCAPCSLAKSNSIIGKSSSEQHIADQGICHAKFLILKMSKMDLIPGDEAIGHFVSKVSTVQSFNRSIFCDLENNLT